MELNWTIELLDNGITIEDSDERAKEAALYGKNQSEGAITQLLGTWLWTQIHDNMQYNESIRTRVRITLEDYD